MLANERERGEPELTSMLTPRGEGRCCETLVEAESPPAGTEFLTRVFSETEEEEFTYNSKGLQEVLWHGTSEGSVVLGNVPEELIHLICFYCDVDSLLSLSLSSKSMNTHVATAFLLDRNLPLSLPSSCYYTLKSITLLWGPEEVQQYGLSLISSWATAHESYNQSLLTTHLSGIFEADVAPLPAAPSTREDIGLILDKDLPREKMVASVTNLIYLSYMERTAAVISHCLRGSVVERSPGHPQSKFIDTLTELLNHTVKCASQLDVIRGAKKPNVPEAPQSPSAPSKQFASVVSKAMEACSSLIVAGPCPQQFSSSFVTAIGNLRCSLLYLVGYLAEINCKDLCVKARQLIRMIRFRYKVHCLGCGHKEKNIKELKVCACCKIATYCGPECQRQDWVFHRMFCTFVSNLK